MEAVETATALADREEKERRRLQALHALGVLDAPAEALLDALTRSAAAACGMPLAMLNEAALR